VGDVALFAFDEVQVEVDGVPILAGVSAVVPTGGVTCFVGPSGSGKSTMLRLCNALGRPTHGIVRFRGEDVAGLDPLALRRRVGMVFQRPTPFPGTVRDNLAEAAPRAGEDAWRRALDRAELSADMLDRDVGGLSGGEAQRMCLARSMAAEPEVLLLDEPTSAVDPETRKALEHLVRGLADTYQGVVWVTHDHAQVRRLADHVLVLARGRVIAAGTTSAVEGHLHG
jgi:putative ABC transport system ATP-binding protein